MDMNAREIRKTSKYTIMYKETPVLLFDRKADEVTVYEPKYLPFALRGLEIIRPVDAFEWIANRIDSTQRTYMNMVYIARKVGRDRDKMIEDSSGISFTDNFWIKTSDNNHTWDGLYSLRDKSRELSLYALTGKTDNPTALLKGHTSLFTTKGFFTKAIIGENLVKLREDTVLEYPAYLFGEQIGVSVAKCELDGDFVNIRLFTSNDISLVHAAELKRYFDTDEEIYNEFIRLGRKDIAGQIERMYIFNYLIGNPDMHDENTGVLYDAQTFEFISLAPCFDHNIAFHEEFMGVSHATKGRSSLLPLDDWSKKFIRNHPDILEKLKTVDYTEIKKYIPKERFAEFVARIKELLGYAMSNGDIAEAIGISKRSVQNAFSLLKQKGVFTRQEIIDYCLTLPSTYEDYPFDDITDPGKWTVMRHRANKKSFALVYERGGKLCVNLKCDPFEADLLRQMFADVTAGYHMNKTHWNTITMGGDVPDEELRRMIDKSYNLIKPKARKKPCNVST